MYSLAAVLLLVKLQSTHRAFLFTKFEFDLLVDGRYSILRSRRNGLSLVLEQFDQIREYELYIADEIRLFTAD